MAKARKPEKSDSPFVLVINHINDLYYDASLILDLRSFRFAIE